MILNKIARHKGIHLVRFHLYECQEEVKLFNVVRSLGSGHLWVGGKGRQGGGMRGLQRCWWCSLSWSDAHPGVCHLWQFLELNTVFVRRSIWWKSLSLLFKHFSSILTVSLNSTLFGLAAIYWFHLPLPAWEFKMRPRRVKPGLEHGLGTSLPDANRIHSRLCWNQHRLINTHADPAGIKACTSKWKLS